MCICAGMALAALAVLALVWPATARSWVVSFPRNRVAAWVLSALALFWVANIVQHGRLGRFEPWKVYVWPGYTVALIAVGLFMDDLLAVRALGGILLLGANPVLRAVRLHDSPWASLVAAVTYGVIVLGIAWILGPYRFRRWLSWMLSPERYRWTCSGVLLLGALLCALGLTVL